MARVEPHRLAPVRHAGLHRNVSLLAVVLPRRPHRHHRHRRLRADRLARRRRAVHLPLPPDLARSRRRRGRPPDRRRLTSLLRRRLGYARLAGRPPHVLGGVAGGLLHGLGTGQRHAERLGASSSTSPAPPPCSWRAGAGWPSAGRPTPCGPRAGRRRLDRGAHPRHRVGRCRAAAARLGPAGGHPVASSQQPVGRPRPARRPVSTGDERIMTGAPGGGRGHRPPRSRADRLARRDRWRAHLDRFGPLRSPIRHGRSSTRSSRAGLRGRGGAGFPTAVEARRRRALGSRRSLLGRRRRPRRRQRHRGRAGRAQGRVLLALAPHLVIDGAVAAAAAVGADGGRDLRRSAQPAAIGAVGARPRASASAPRQTPCPSSSSPRRRTTSTGEESALVHFLNGGDAKPDDGAAPPVRARRRRPSDARRQRRDAGQPRPHRPLRRGVVAHVGTATIRASRLVTLTGAVDRPGVYELPLGVQLGQLLEHAGAQPDAAC